MLSNNLQAEERTSSEIPEKKPEKKRFKLDKKHIQGFIAGILLCAIAFTGLYYGTNGRFFEGRLIGFDFRVECHECDFKRWFDDDLFVANEVIEEHIRETGHESVYLIFN